MQTPDTTPNVGDAIYESHRDELLEGTIKPRSIARTAIAAHNRALAEAIPEQRPTSHPEPAHRWSQAFCDGFNEARRLFLGLATEQKGVEP